MYECFRGSIVLYGYPPLRALSYESTLDNLKRVSNDQLLAALGQKIRAAREAKKISQENFAAEAGVARSYYGGVERGARNISAINLMRLADQLGVEVGELFPPLSEIREKLKRP